MPSCKCGDKVQLDMTFEAPLNEELATVLVSRKDMVPSHKADFIIKGTDIKIPFPDIQPGGRWCGGAQAYFVGLDDDWNNRWSMQELNFEVFVGDKTKKSGSPLKIERFPNTKTSPYETSMRLQPTEEVTFLLHDELGIRRVPYYKEVGNSLKYNGKFDIELKNDEIIITVKIDWDFDFDYKPTSDDHNTVKHFYKNLTVLEKYQRFSDFKREYCKSVSKHWNTELKKYKVHRKNCVRGKDCNCQKGCCNFGLCLEIEDGSHHKVKVIIGYGRANAGTFYTIQMVNHWIHEIGHLLGLPDEYRGGMIAAGIRSKFKADDPESIMNGGLTVKKEHVEFIVGDWIRDALGEEFEVVEL